VNKKIKNTLEKPDKMLKTTKVNTYTGCFTSDNEPGGIENATHTTFPKLT
jgi:hypothetical protein